MSKATTDAGATTVREVSLVSGKGTDADIAALCAESVAGWDNLSERGKADIIRGMREIEARKAPPVLAVNKMEGGGISVIPAGANDTLILMRQAETFATSSSDLINARIGDLINHHSANNRRGVTTEALNADLALISGGNPTDAVQATLLTQMAATHDAAMRALAMVGKADFAEQAKVFGNLSAKLLNAFTRQAETLAKLQRGGEQVVKHVHIDNRNGGQAIVAETFVKGGASEESRNQFHEQCAYGPSVLGYDAAGHGVPLSGDEGQEALPPAWREGDGRAQGE